VFKFGSIQDYSVVFSICLGIISLFVIAVASRWVLLSKNKNLSRIWFFGIGWIVMVNLFVAFSVPFPKHVIAQKYDYSTVLTRYNYFGYIGIIILLAVFLTKVKKHKNRVYLVLFLWFVYNFVTIQISGRKLFENKHVQAKDFHQKIEETYVSFPEYPVIYYNFFHVDNLRDRVWEIVHIYSKKNSPNSNFLLLTALSSVQKGYFQGEFNIDDVIVFDIDEKGYLIDKTEILREILLNLRKVELDEDEDVLGSYKVPGDILANLKYDLEFEARVSGLIGNGNTICDTNAETNSDDKSSELMKYLDNRNGFLKRVKVEVSSSKGIHSIFPYINENNLVDNQFDNYSIWQPDSFTSGEWVIMDLGEVRTISGIAWASDGNNGNPSYYEYLISDDRKNWESMLKVDNNTLSSRLDRISQVETRYVKMVIHSTKLGQEVTLREIEAVDYPNMVLEKYKAWESLIQDVEDVFCNLELVNSERPKIEIGKVVWKSDKGTVNERNIFFNTGNNWVKYKVPILTYEPFSKDRQILEENLIKIYFKLGKSGLNYQIRNVVLVPSAD
jgi:hypothetical protein